jgi:NAD(P)-dependent dehydrogenase (short-subunit alcohol dehydrogenase family)
LTIDEDILGLRNVVTLVTGAGSGIGKAVALIYAQAGAQVACCGAVEDAEAATAAQITAAGGRAIHMRTDVTRQDEVRAMVAAVEARLGPLEVAVNVVGGLAGQRPKPFMDLTLEDWEIPVRNNLTSTMLCCQAEGIAMARRGTRGRIVNFASASGIAGAAHMAHYGAAKAAVIHLTKTVALEYAAYGIRVNCVVPGAHMTPSVERQAADPQTGAAMREFLERANRMTPMGRMGEAWETAGTALFLGSRLSSFMTGHSVVSDGGALIANARGGVAEGLTPKALAD